VKVHPISTGSLRVKRRELSPGSSLLPRRASTVLDRRLTERLPIHAWLIEHADGLILVDTGASCDATYRNYLPRWHPYLRAGVDLHVDVGDDIGHQFRRLGVSTDDVQTVVLTHLHVDHAGGPKSFRNARILIAQAELKAAAGLRGQFAGYANHYWPDWFTPEALVFGQPPGPFKAAASLTPGSEVVAVATPGHTRGHVSVVVERDESPRLFLAGDASATQAAMLRGDVDGVCVDARAARDILARIRRYLAAQPTVYLPSHDPDAARCLAELEVVDAVDPELEAAPQRPPVFASKPAAAEETL
jgi:N-acyl homoserine lactone hydrolase